MSQQQADTAQGVRIPLVSKTRPHRSLEERILVRFPRVARWLRAFLLALPPTSRLRQAILARALQQAYAAWNRRDFDFLVTALDPGYELHTGHVLPEVGSIFHGHDGLREFARELLGGVDARLDPQEALDFGERVLVTTKLTGHGTGSGVLVSQPLYQVMTFRRGLMVRQHDFQDRREALRAVNVSE